MFRKTIARIARSQPYLSLVAWFLRAIMEALFATLRVEYRGREKLPEKCIVALWHNKLLLAPLLRKRFPEVPLTVVVSKSRDGLLLSCFAKTFSRVTAIQVSHKSRHGALLQIVEELEQNRVVIITPDGPRGPKHVLKPGILFSSKHAEAPIIPVVWQATKVFRFSTWDEMELPLPFSKVVLTVKEPIFYFDGQQTSLPDALTA